MNLNEAADRVNTFTNANEHTKALMVAADFISSLHGGPNAQERADYRALEAIEALHFELRELTAGMQTLRLEITKRVRERAARTYLSDNDRKALGLA